eukprot:scaffold1197_cov228-Pinguiococcus_pyrenoidosus.AAC.4
MADTTAPKMEYSLAETTDCFVTPFRADRLFFTAAPEALRSSPTCGASRILSVTDLERTAPSRRSACLSAPAPSGFARKLGISNVRSVP